MPMHLKSLLPVVGVAAIVVAAGAYYWSTRSIGLSASEDVPLATPPGLTIQRVGETKVGQLQIPPLLSRAGRRMAYADAKGMTLYTYAKDAPGKSACMGECAKAWPPAIAQADAKPVGDWSVIAREDGTRQWARKGMPLYVFAKDTMPGEMNGESADKGNWHAASLQLAAETPLPKRIIDIREVADANGQALVTEDGITLYGFRGDVNEDKSACAALPCANHWMPFAAPQIANAIGDFSLVSRRDGIKQWAYKGQPLYTFDGDVQAGDANGAGVDNRWRVALVMRYFQPAEVAIREEVEHGRIFTTASGMTLYRLDGYTYEPGGHGLFHALPTRPMVGRQIGTKSCIGDCLKTWHPLAAPANAQPSGYWEVAFRDDGTRQWVYQGYPIYTYAGDKKPGDVTGNDVYELRVSDDPNKPADIPIYQMGAGALFWTFISP